MTKEELLKEIMELPKVETINSISAMNAINVDDLMSAVDRFDKVPDYNDLLKENQQLKIQISAREEEYKKLEDNWNKLKKYINEANEDLYWTNNYDDILYVMQELEQGSDSNE